MNPQVPEVQCWPLKPSTGCTIGISQFNIQSRLHIPPSSSSCLLYPWETGHHLTSHPGFLISRNVTRFPLSLHCCPVPFTAGTLWVHIFSPLLPGLLRQPPLLISVSFITLSPLLPQWWLQETNQRPCLSWFKMPGENKFKNKNKNPLVALYSLPNSA